MNDFDKKLKAQAKIENITCPKEVSDAIDNVLNSLPEEAEASYENYKKNYKMARYCCYWICSPLLIPFYTT